MRKFILSMATSFILTACGSDSTTSTTTTSTNNNCSIVLSGPVISTKSSDCNYTLTATGQTYSVKTGSDINEVIIDGSNNLISFEDGSIISIITVNGNDNTLSHSVNNVLTIDNDNGLGNSVIIN